MSRLNNEIDRDDYDEFQFLESHATWAGLPWNGRPAVVRDEVRVDGRAISFLRWGSGDPDLVLLHGAAQNAHTWDTFAMAAGRPVVAIDLPGHGRSAWREDGDYSPECNAIALATVISEVAPKALGVVGMSLGGLTSIRLAALGTNQVRSVVVVDITPAPARIQGESATGRVAASPRSLTLLAGPRRYESWEAMLVATQAAMPHRTRESLVPSLRHNARRFEDGSWGWRYDRPVREGADRPDHTHLWDEIAGFTMPAMFVIGARSGIVSAEALAELGRRLPSARVEIVDAGHAIQSERPAELARLVNNFLQRSQV